MEEAVIEALIAIHPVDKMVSEIFHGEIALSLGGEERTARSRFPFLRSRKSEIVERCRPSEVKERRAILRKDMRLIADHRLLGFRSPNQALEPTRLIAQSLRKDLLDFQHQQPRGSS